MTVSAVPPALAGYAVQSPFSDPGRHASLLDALPTDIRELMAVVRNVLVHYRASGIDLPPERLAAIDSRWVDRILDVDQARHGTPLGAPRAEVDRVACCCRDFTLLTMAALRHRGVPARSRIGFAGYFQPDWHYDHVVVEHWDGSRWVFSDAQIAPAAHWGFDPADVPRLVGSTPPRRPPFETAGQAWAAYRRGELDVSTYGVAPGLPFAGGWFVRDEVIYEVAHRYRDELLLWDAWGAIGPDSVDPVDDVDSVDDVELIDEVAALLLAADDGDEVAERELAERYAVDPRLHPGRAVTCLSPTGTESRVDLRRRAVIALAEPGTTRSKQTTGDDLADPGRLPPPSPVGGVVPQDDEPATAPGHRGVAEHSHMEPRPPGHGVVGGVR